MNNLQAKHGPSVVHVWDIFFVAAQAIFDPVYEALIQSLTS
jgi:hypothetical protein